MAYISLTDYAKKHRRSHTTVYRKYQSGGFATAQKLGRTVVIDENEPYVTQRKARVCADADMLDADAMRDDMSVHGADTSVADVACENVSDVVNADADSADTCVTCVKVGDA